MFIHEPDLRSDAMLRKTRMIGTFLAIAMCFGVGADVPGKPVNLPASEIVDRNVSARGGLAAWRAVQTLSMSGQLQAGGDYRATLQMPESGKPVASKKGETMLPAQRLKQQAELPFVMDLKRTRKSRIEIHFNGQTAVQVYDGTTGWKLRPFLNRHQVEPYTAEEMKAAAMASDLDGPLVDYAAKGTKVELDGMEKVEGRDTYKLKLTLKGEQVLHVWIDAQTFLEAKIEGTPRRLDGRYHAVSTYCRDYRAVHGLMVPHLLETVVDGIRETEKIQIENVTVNPKLDDALFAKLQP
jgi:outer membrane lipoprotein-sorting protein